MYSSTFFFTDSQILRQRQMLGEGHSAVQGTGQFLRNETIRLHSPKRYSQYGSEILPEYFDANPSGAGVFPGRFLRSRSTTLCAGMFEFYYHDAIIFYVILIDLTFERCF